MASFFDEALMISLDVPAGWQAERTDELELLILAPVVDNYRPNLGFTLRRLDPPTLETFHKLIADTQADQQRTFNGYVLNRAEDRTIDSRPAHTRYFEWTDAESGLHFAQFQTFIFVEPRIYIIDGSALIQHADVALPFLDSIVAGIRFIPDRPE